MLSWEPFYIALVKPECATNSLLQHPCKATPLAPFVCVFWVCRLFRFTATIYTPRAIF